MKPSAPAAFCLLTSVLVTVFVARDAARAGAEKGNASDAEELRKAVVAAFPEKFSGPIGEPDPPVGSIVAWPVDAIPEGWHVCDGTPLTDCQELRQLLGLTYRPQGDINRTQRLKDAKLAGEEGVVWLPDFRGYFLRGLAAGMSEPMGKAQADAVGKLTVFEHQLTLSGAGKEPSEQFVVGHGENAKGPVSLNKEGETRPKNYAVHWIMRVSQGAARAESGEPRSSEPGTPKNKDLQGNKDQASLNPGAWVDGRLDPSAAPTVYEFCPTTNGAFHIEVRNTTNGKGSLNRVLVKRGDKIVARTGDYSGAYDQRPGKAASTRPIEVAAGERLTIEVANFRHENLLVTYSLRAVME